MDTLPAISPSYNSSPRSQARVLENQFGDGYTQRAADGLNSIETVWTLTWENVLTSEADQLVSFFEAQGGWKAFYWTPPRETTARKWTCKEWEKTPEPGSRATVRAVFQRVFDL